MSLFAKNADGSLKYLSVVTVQTGNAPRNPYATGYGAKIPTSYLAFVNGKWQRVYVAQFSNAGSPWVQVKGERVLIQERDAETPLEHYQVDADFRRFVTGYTACLLWSTTGDHKGKQLDSLEGRSFHPDAFATVLADCWAFYSDNMADVQEAAARYGAKDDPTGYAPAGHDFWLTRAGHGAGFWDGDLPQALGERLTAASKKAGEVWPVVGDDGRVYL